jgi:hypothetical protein
MSIKDAFKEHRSPLVRSAYRAARLPYAYWLRHKRRTGHSIYLKLMEAERDRVIVLSIQQLLHQLEGDIAEFGVRTGVYARVECRELGAWQANRTLHLFDSWDGWGEPTQQDNAAWEIRAGRFPKKAPDGQVPPDVLKARLGKVYDPGRIVIHKGWFSETLPKLPTTVRFGMVVMDADLFSSSLTVFEHLFGRGLLSEGGIILFNSWNAARANPELAVRGAWAKAVEQFGVVYSVTDHYAWSGLKILVHSYRRA